ncbi:MAG: virulence factor Mce family protein, partial [uncultured Solirubrobacteraceae bacterium]
AEVRSQLRPRRGDGRLRAVLLRPAALPVARVRRPRAAQGGGLPLQDLLRRGDPARQGGRRADLRRAGRQGQDGRARHALGPLGGRHRARRALRAAALGRQGDPAPEDAARRDLRRAHPRHAHREGDPRGRPAARVERLADRRARRDLPRLRPEDPRGLPRLDADAGAGRRGPRPRSQRGARQPLAVRPGGVADRRRPQPPGGGAAADRLQHGRRLRRALRAPGAAARPGAERQHRLLDHRAPRPRAAGDLPRPAGLLARVAPDDRAPQPLRGGDRPAHHPAAARGAPAEPDARRRARPRARPARLLHGARAARDSVAGGLPRRAAGPRRPAPAARAGRPGAARAQPDPRLRRALQARDHRVLRQRDGRHPGPYLGDRADLPADHEPAQPGEPRGLSAAPGLQPLEPLPAARRLRAARQGPAGLRGPQLRRRDPRAPRRRGQRGPRHARGAARARPALRLLGPERRAVGGRPALHPAARLRLRRPAHPVPAGRDRPL